jgi:hypothetical protein
MNRVIGRLDKNFGPHPSHKFFFADQLVTAFDLRVQDIERTTSDTQGLVYHCPGGKQIGTSGTVHEGKTLLYRASKLDCDVCPIKSQCCPKEPSRKIPRDIHEHARDVARSFAGIEGFEQSRRERKKIEMRFAHLKRILKLGRLRLRGPRGAQDEFVLAAIAQNLRRLASLVARPPPAIELPECWLRNDLGSFAKIDSSA